MTFHVVSAQITNNTDLMGRKDAVSTYGSPSEASMVTSCEPADPGRHWIGEKKGG